MAKAKAKSGSAPADGDNKPIKHLYLVDGVRHSRNAWIYEAPQPKLAQIKDRVGFWEDVELR
jgi:uncharacterized protein (DUF427 family)